MSNSRSLLVGYQHLPHPIPIKTAADDSNALIVGRGRIEFKTKNGLTAVIEDVYYCPKATATIISPGALIAGGEKVSMSDNNDYTICLKNGIVIYAVHKNRRCFINSRRRLTISSCSLNTTNHAIKESLSHAATWHARMGHVSMKRIKQLFQKSAEYGLPDIKLSDVTCEDCLKCKSTRTRGLGSTGRDPTVMEVLVTDVAGQFTPCLTGEKLMVTFRDVASTYSEVHIIKTKSGVPQKLTQVVKKWERETDQQVKIIQSDRGGEYIGSTLDIWFKDKGITPEFSNPYEPEHNRVAERLNRTLGKMARTLLSAFKLQKNFWKFAYLTAAYLNNRLPNSTTRDLTPNEIFHKRKPNLEILRTFGSVTFVHIHTGQRPSWKLEDRGRRCVMIGYIRGGKGWLFYDEETKTVFASAIAQFPYETSNTPANVHNEATTFKSINKILNVPTANKGSLNHIINSLKLGDFSNKIKLDKQDVSASVALDGNDYLKILQAPKSYAKAMRSEHGSMWKDACDTEMEMMATMSVWECVKKPDGLAPIGLKWVFTYKKFDDDSNHTKFKAQIVAKGYSQKEALTALRHSPSLQHFLDYKSCLR